MSRTRILQIVLPTIGLVLIVVAAIFAVQSHAQHEQAKKIAAQQLLREIAPGGALAPGLALPGLPAAKSSEVVDGVIYTIKRSGDGASAKVSVTSGADGFTYTVGGGKPGSGSCVNLLCHFG